MDYAPVLDTVTPPVYAKAQQDWFPIAATSTAYVLKVPAPVTREVQSTDRHQSVTPTFVILDLPAFTALERLRSFRDFPDGWDAEGGLAPNPEAIDTASKVFGIVAQYVTPKVTLNSSGEPMLVFDAPHRGEIVINSPNTFHYFFDADDAPFGDDVKFEGYLPTELTNYLQA